MEFKEYSLSELSKENKGTYGIGASAVNYDKNLYTYLRITDIKEDGTLDRINLKSVNDENADKYVLKKGDIVFARTGNSTGKSYYYDGEIENLVYAGFLIKFSLDETKVNPQFIKYYTLTNEYKNWVKEIQTGSTRGNINEKMYGNMKIKLPPRYYQDKMVILLEKIDKKIELNNKMNENLFQLNKCIYYSNIEKIKGDYSDGFYKKLDQIVNINSRGISPEYADNGIPVINQSCIRNGIITEEKIQYHNKDNKTKEEYYYKKYDVLINSMGVGTLGRISQIGELDKQYLIHSCITVIRAKENIISQFILGQEILSKQFEIENMGQGTTGQTSLKNKELGNMMFFVPPFDIQKKIEPILKYNIDKITQNLMENKKLSEIRDILLPKLMNGEIDLDKIEI